MEIKSAIGIVIQTLSNGTKKVLLGKSLNKDSRYGLLCFPGGGVDKGELPRDAAVREVFEEAAVTCKVKQIDGKYKYLELESKPFLRFYLCNYVSGKPKLSNEFSTIGFYDVNEIINNEGVYDNNKMLLKYCIDNKLL